MGFLDKIFAAARAINAGESLKNPATWKSRQLLANAFIVIIGAVPVFVPDLQLSNEDIGSISTGLAVLGGVLNSYFTVATSEKVGTKTRNKNR